MKSGNQKRLVFFGDSICVGQGVSIHKGWVTRIAARLAEICEKNGWDIVVVNASVNGSTTRQALERMPYEVQSHGCDIVIVQFGMNDCNHWQTDCGLPRVSPRAFAANLEEIIARSFTFGARKVLLNTNHPTMLDREKFPGTNLTYQECNARYNEIIREVAAGHGSRVILSDVEAHFNEVVGNDRSKLAQLLLPEGLHLSEKGHDVYYETIGPIIVSVVEELFEHAAA